MNEQVIPRRGGQYVECATCGDEVPIAEAVDIGIDPATDEPLYLCQECDEREEDE